MLRVSAQKNDNQVDIQGIGGDAASAAEGIEFGSELMRFAEAIGRRDPVEIAGARQVLLETAGSAVLVDAAGVAANFQRMVRIADSIGIPYDDPDSPMSQAIQQELGLDKFASAKQALANSVRY